MTSLRYGKKTTSVFSTSLGLLMLFVALLLSSCHSAKKAPEWVTQVTHNEGSSKDSVCGVGMSIPHYKGYSYQRVTAIGRAIDEIARQINVKVDTSVTTLMSVSGGSVNSDVTTYSLHTTEGEVINAKLMESWLDRSRSEFYVHMCAY